MANEIKLLARIFAKKEWAEDFYSSGKFRMNTLSSFKNYPDEHANNIGDQLEGASRIYHEGCDLKLTIKFDDEVHDIFDFKSVIIAPTHILNRNVFCMYAPSIDTESRYTLDQMYDRILLQEETKNLGDYIVAITDIGEFFNRFKREIARLGYDAKGGLVKYRDITQQTILEDDEIGFVKSIDYAHQKEFRIMINTNKNVDEHIDIEIGPLSDIAKLFNTCDFNDLLRIDVKKALEVE